MAATSTDFSAGTVNSTGNEDDMAIGGTTGAGFFVVQNGNTTEYTRDGNFTVSPEGYLTTQGGLQVMGYPVVNGVVDTNAPLVPIQIPPARHLAAAGCHAESFHYREPRLVRRGGEQVPGRSSSTTRSARATDATVTFTNTGTGTWNYSIALPAGSSTGGTGLTGALAFDSNGNLTTPSSTAGPVSALPAYDGASNMSFNWNLSGQRPVDHHAVQRNLGSMSSY